MTKTTYFTHCSVDTENGDITHIPAYKRPKDAKAKSKCDIPITTSHETGQLFTTLTAVGKLADFCAKRFRYGTRFSAACTTEKLKNGTKKHTIKNLIIESL